MIERLFSDMRRGEEGEVRRGLRRGKWHRLLTSSGDDGDPTSLAQGLSDVSDAGDQRPTREREEGVKPSAVVSSRRRGVVLDKGKRGTAYPAGRLRTGWH
jgi:hypothetical protein